LNSARLQLLGLVAASVLGTAGLLLAGGGTAILETLAQLEQRKVMVILEFAVWALVANCLVLPAGSLSLVAGGAILGMAAPALIWFAAQLVTAPLIYRTGAGSRDRIEPLVTRYLGSSAVRIVARAAHDGVATTILLRLTPILPSAPACLIAAWAGIDLKSFMIGSGLAGWVRPLYFASLGAAAGELARVGATLEALSLRTLLALAIPCACAAVVLAARLHLSRRTG
jgi:uncharacterized membrane protein YdjX (TVP38/TMEM64 family)